VFFSAVLVAANAALLDLADVAGASAEDRGQLARWLDRGRAGLASRFDAQTAMCGDFDVRAGEDIRLRTFASFAPLFSRTADAGQQAAQMRLLDSADFCGHPRFRWPLLPSTSPAEPAFEPQNYWRGPVWPVISWLLWQSLNQLGYPARADAIRSDSLSQLVAAGEFGEYFEPFTGKQLGSTQQSWTAAVTLDWLASGQHGEGNAGLLKWREVTVRAGRGPGTRPRAGCGIIAKDFAFRGSSAANKLSKFREKGPGRGASGTTGVKRAHPRRLRRREQSPVHGPRRRAAGFTGVETSIPLPGRRPRP
jgi:hypothetical protein